MSALGECIVEPHTAFPVGHWCTVGVLLGPTKCDRVSRVRLHQSANSCLRDCLCDCAGVFLRFVSCRPDYRVSSAIWVNFNVGWGFFQSGVLHVHVCVCVRISHWRLAGRKTRVANTYRGHHVTVELVAKFQIDAFLMRERSLANETVR